LDGDGAVLMHMGILANIAASSPSNFKHIIFNNGTHDSVGGQPTVAGNRDQFSFSQIAQGCGYKHVMMASTKEEIDRVMKTLREMNNDGPVLVELRVKSGHRKTLGRPTRSTNENKNDFMHFLQLS
jgi:phosphonopyruvate decarboxylase